MDNPQQNPFSERTKFNHETEGRKWANKLIDGLNATNWKYPDTIKKNPFQYAGLDTSTYGNIAVLDQIFLNDDIKSILPCLYNNKIPTSMESKLLESIFSDPISNNPSAILGCENITTKRVRGGTFRQETALSQESDDDDEEFLDIIKNRKKRKTRSSKTISLLDSDSEDLSE